MLINKAATRKAHQERKLIYQRTKVFLHVLLKTIPVIDLCHVHGVTRRTLTYALLRQFQIFLVDVCDDHGHPIVVTFFGQGQTNATGASCNQGNVASFEN